MNVAARLASAAGVGEMLLTMDAVDAVHLSPGQLARLEHRDLALKGRSEPVPVAVLAERAAVG